MLTLQYMYDEQEDFGFDEVLELVSQFEKMIDGGSYSFFDIEDIEDIIDHYLQVNDKIRARQALNFASIQHPNATGVMLRQAHYLITENKSDEALSILNKIESLEPDNIDIHMAKGIIFSQKKMAEEASMEFEKALREAEFPAEICVNIAFEFENQNNFEMAIQYFRKSLDLDPENEAAIYEIAYCYEILNQYEDAVQFFVSFLDKNPYSVTAWFNLGLTYNSLELYEKAIESYDFVIAIDETFASAYFNKANSYANMGMFREAIEFYRQTFLYEDPEAITYYYMGECYQKLKRFADAVTCYLKSLELDSNLSDAWLELGATYEELGQLTDAIRCVEKAISIETDNMEYHHVLAGLLAKSNRFHEAKAAFKKIISSNYKSPDVWLDYAELIADQEDTLKAIGILTKAVRSFPENSLIIYRLAAYHFNAGWTKEAIRLLQKALSLDFDNYTEIELFAPQMLKVPDVTNLIESMRNGSSKKHRKRHS